MKIFGKDISKKELIRRIGDISQLGGIKYYEFLDGRSKGIRAVDIKTPAGIDMTILIDRGLDISYLSYKSVPFGWRSATKEISPFYYDPRGLEFFWSFYGGLLTTCGLDNIGGPCTDDSEELGLHGRISNIAAENVAYDIDCKDNDYVAWVKGKLREVKVFGDKLELRRKIITWFDKTKILIEDNIENIGHVRSPIMILYHINIGYPVLDRNSELIEARAKIIANDEESEKGLKNYFKFGEPESNGKMQVYFHDIEPDEEGFSNIALVNKEFNNGEGIGIWVRFEKKNLPYLIQWKNLGEGEYVCGIEPANSLVRGRDVERKEGTLKFIDPQEKFNYKVELNILKDKKDIESFMKKFS